MHIPLKNHPISKQKITSQALRKIHQNTYKRKLTSKRVNFVFLTNSGIGLKWGFPIWLTFFPSLSKKYSLHFYLYAMYKLLVSKRLRLKKGNGKYLAIHNHWSRGYHHWLSEVLVKIFHIEGIPQSYHVLLPEDYPDFALESLKAFPFLSIVKIPRRLQVFSPRLTLVENPTSGTFNPKDINMLRDYFWKRYQIQPKQEKCIYISRKAAPTRNIDNEEELTDLLAGFGFEIIQAETFSFEQQVRLFSSCKLLLSIHGAGLTNCIFMPPHAILFELYRDVSNEPQQMNPCFLHLAEAASLHYEVQFSEETSNAHTNPNDANIKVDLDELAFRLKELLSHESAS